MKTPLVDILPELLELLVFSVGSVALTLAGAAIERFAVATAQGGQLALGAWVALMGLMAVYFAYLLFTDKALPRYTAVVRTLREA